MNHVLVVGLGSMGKRRIRLMRSLNRSLLIFGIDAKATRREEVRKAFGITCFACIGEAIENVAVEAGFVCTSPLSHYQVIMELLKAGLHVFTEINLVSDGYEEMTALAKEKGKVLFLSSTFLYRKDIQYIIQRTQGEKVDYMVHIGQYLPDWHPWESYKDFFVSNIRTNGCREIMAIDFPWIQAAFGRVTDVHVRKSKNSSMELDYEDNYLLSMEHEGGSKGVVVIDLLSRKAGRSASIISENLYLTWNGTPDSLIDFDIETKKDVLVATYTEVIDHQAAYASNIIENAYMAEIETFFQAVEDAARARYTFDDDLATIQLINQIEGRA